MTAPLSVVCWKWRPFEGYRSSYTAEYVNILRRMVARHYPDPHRFVCVTDDPAGLDATIDVVPIWSDYGDMFHPFDRRHPSCYRRLKAFAPEMADVFGPRFVSIDLDCVILDDLRPLWNRPEPFVGLKGSNDTKCWYNGSMWLMTAGARPYVWTDFDPTTSPEQAKAAGYYGSDQAWISYRLGPDEACWTTKDGVYSYRLHVAPVTGMPAPPGARVIIFNGKRDPWHPDVRPLPWVREHWR